MTIKTLFLDVGGVLLTNGWDGALRKKAAEAFQLDFDLMESKHRQIFDDFERGEITLEEYIKFITYGKPGSVVAELEKFIFTSVRPYFDMIELIEYYKNVANVKILLLSNEGAEIAKNRFKQFPQIVDFSDAYVVSGFVGYRKPDLRIYTLALGVVQEEPAEILYIDDRMSNLEPAKNMGIHTICHKDYATTSQSLKQFFS